MKSTKFFLLLGVAFGFLGSAHAQQSQRIKSQFDDFKGDGYYWYRQEPEPVAPKVEPPKPPPPSKAEPAKSEVKPLSAEWMRVNLPKLLDASIDNPTTENVANYMYAQRVLLDKSQNFSEKVKEVVATDPFLDENNRVPIAQFAQPAFGRGVASGQDEVLNHLGSHGGIWVFVDDAEKCSACASYVANILVGTESVKGIAAKYKFNFRKIYVNTVAGKAAAKRLNLKVTPTTVLVLPPNGFYLISQGLMSQPVLSERLMIAAKASGTLPKELEQKINPYNKGVLTTEEMDDLKVNENPSEVMKSMRERIKGDK